MISKKIHYCWFGRGKLPAKSQEYISGWKKLHPNYEIIEWNEDNFDIHHIRYVREAYENRKYAFVSDYVRLYALYQEGGIYLDTDIEILKSLNEFRKSKGFLGFECKDSLMTAVMGTEKGNADIKKLMNEYVNRSFVLEDGTLDITTNVYMTTRYFEKQGLILNGKAQMINNFKIFPSGCFSPNTLSMVLGLRPARAYTVHHVFGSWNLETRRDGLKNRCKHYVGGIARNILGSENYAKFRKIERL